ncbi:cytochrome c1 [Motiliproteus coralliicola]|uniref:Cytochrome c1 n=1 Tax=Motiliproteus coralliicola TaxID=2283196 RepID=A0A369WMM0_9GAMM|nr:cytochrome c1 [Motiliproteus coralliicola]RDE22962.1 cytochrome c1 [Motiliproteus coralliicola]
MKKLLIAFVCALLPVTSMAAGVKVDLLPFEANLDDKESLQNGMKLFVENCMGCHSAKYQRYERAADDLEMDKAYVEENLIVGDKKIGEHMTIGMSAEDGANWFGAPPPDLTLEARLRGDAWVYTYLKSFYVDESKQWGVNNKVFPDVGMPNVLQGMQGVQVCKGENCEEFELIEQGSMTPEEFDKAMYDLTNFMSYIGEPSKMVSGKLGMKVLIFLAILFVFAYLLKKEYWRDVKSGSWREKH